MLLKKINKQEVEMPHKTNKKSILFINPPFTDFRMGVAGIAYLRGSLESKNISSVILNLNDIILFNKDCKNKLTPTLKLLSETININKNINISELVDSDIITSNFLACPNENVWRLIKDISILKSVFEKYLDDLNNYQYVGISITYKSQILFSLMLAHYIKNLNKSIKIIFGGVIVSGLLDDFVRFLSNSELVDYFIIGEGMTAMHKLIEGVSLKQIPNLFYKVNQDYKFSEQQDYCEDLLNLSTPLYEPNDIPVIFSSRQCYWNKCVFCRYFNLYPGKKSIPVDVVAEKIKEIQREIKDDNNTCFFADSSLPIGFVKQLSKIIIADETMPRSYRAYVRLEPSINREFLEVASRAGFGRGKLGAISFGLETSVPRLLKIINKGINFNDAERILKMCFDLGINIDLNFMIGLPTQTKEELNQEIAYMNKIINKYNNVSISCKPLIIHRGSELFLNSKKYNIEVLPGRNEYFNIGFPFLQKDKNAISTLEAIIMFLDFYYKLSPDYRDKFRDINRLMLYPL